MVERIVVPILFVAREADEIATLKDVRALYQLTGSAHKRLLVLRAATHDSLGPAPEEYPRGILAFLDSVLAGKVPGESHRH